MLKIKNGFFVLFFIFQMVDLFAQNKKALVVAIGNYPFNSGFRSISSINDIPLIQDALKNTYGGTSRLRGAGPLRIRPAVS